MTAKYRLSVEADSLAELTGAVTETAALLQSGDASAQLVAELMPLVDPTLAELPPGAEQPPLPTPPPDYAAAGLTDWQAIRARTAGASAPTAPAVAVEAVAPAVALSPGSKPFCGIHQVEMVWKGAGLSKAGKGLPLWSCPDRNCREAIWPAR